MTAELPIACTLTPNALSARIDVIDALARDGLIDRVPTESGLCVRLRDTPELEQRVRDLIRAESECCAFLQFTLGREGDAIVLEISGPEDARPVIDMFFGGA